MLEIILIRNMIISNKHMALKFPEIFFFTEHYVQRSCVTNFARFPQKAGQEAKYVNSFNPLYESLSAIFRPVILCKMKKKAISNFSKI